MIKKKEMLAYLKGQALAEGRKRHINGDPYSCKIRIPPDDIHLFRYDAKTDSLKPTLPPTP